MNDMSIKGLRYSCLMVLMKTSPRSWIIAISFSWTYPLSVISRNILRYSARSWKMVLKFRFFCSLLPTLASFYSEKLAEPLLSFFRPCCMSSSGLVLHETGPTLWNSCSCADCSTQAADQLQPAFHIQNIILLDLQPKPQQHLAFKQGVLILCL